MTPKLKAKRKSHREPLLAEDGSFFDRLRTAKYLDIGDTVFIAKRLNSPKSEGQVFEIYHVVLEEAKWSREIRMTQPSFSPKAGTYFGKSRFIVEKV